MPHPPGRLRSLFSRTPRRSGGFPRGDLDALAAIEQWTFPAGEPPRTVGIHVVVGSADWRRAAWTLASWMHFTESAWRLTIHDDGTLTDEMAAALTKLFPQAWLIRRKEADAALQPILTAFPFCETFRDDHPSALRIFDAAHFSVADKFLFFGNDVLFFNYPRMLVDWAESSSDDCWFSEALAERSILSAVEARDELGLEIWPRVGDGIWLISKTAFDRDFIDSVLARTSILHGSLEHAARTLAMLCAARAGKGGLLPQRFEVSTHKVAADDAVARQYEESSRERYVSDGLRRVMPHLFPPPEASVTVK